MLVTHQVNVSALTDQFTRSGQGAVVQIQPHGEVEELDFLANYDKTKQAIQEIVDMPDRLIDLFIQFCLQNNGRLSARKRESHFGFLTDGELADMENAVREGYARD